MAHAKVLIVCEGPTDFVVLEGIINHIEQLRGIVFDVKMLAPQIDATTGKPERHGWTGVKRWCNLYATKEISALSHLPVKIQKAVLNRTWKNLLLASNADLLLVQIDTDIAHDVDVNFDITSESRRDCCHRNMCSWLGITKEPNECKFVLPTYAIETWLLATYDATDNASIFTDIHNNYELFDDYEAKLISLGYPSKVGNVARKLKKDTKKYKYNDKYLPRLISKIEISKSRCVELNNFMNIIRNV